MKDFDFFGGIREALETRKDRSAWDKGVTLYALEFVGELKQSTMQNGHAPRDVQEFKKFILNGARDFEQYSYGGCSLVYDGDIAERLCCPSELKKNRNGERNPNSRENWLDVQIRALYQASNRLYRAYVHALDEME